MPTILRSSAVGKLRLGSTTTVPSPRSSGSLAGYRTAKVRCSSSKGTIGGAHHIAKDNQSIVARSAPDFSESSFSARLVGAGGRWASVTASWGHDPVDHLLRCGRGRADLPAAGRRLLPPGGRRPGPAPPLPRGGPVRGRGAPAPVPDAVLGWPPHLQRDQGPPGPAHAPPPVRHRPGRARRLAAPHDRRRPGPGAARRAGRPPAGVPDHGRNRPHQPPRSLTAPAGHGVGQHAQAGLEPGHGHALVVAVEHGREVGVGRLEAERGEAVAGGPQLRPELGVGEAGGDGGHGHRARVVVGDHGGQEVVQLVAGRGHGRGAAGAEELELDVGTGHRAQLGQELGLAGADGDAAVQLGLGLAGDDVDLAAGVDHGRAGRVAQHRAEQAGQSRVADTPVQDQAGPAGVQQQWQGGPAGPALELGQGLEEPPRLGRGVQGQPAPPDPGQELRQPDHGVVVAGDAAVPGGPGGQRPQPGDALLGHLDRVEGPPAQVEGGPADLPEGVAGPNLVRVVVDQPGAARGAAGLLVGDHGQLELAPQGHAQAGQQPEGGHAHGHHLLHVDRSPAPEHAVVDLPGERRVPPAPGLGRDHVDVAVEQQRGLGPVAPGEPGDQVGPARGRRQQLQHRPALELPVDLLQRRVHCVPPVGWLAAARRMPAVTKYIYVMQRVRKAHQDKLILDDVTLAFLPGAKIGVVGPNGAGKSTVLEIMAGLETISNGEAALAPGASVGILLQEPALDPAKDVLGNVEEGVAPTRALLARFEHLSARLGEAGPEEMERLLDEFAKMQDAIEAAGAWDLDAQLEMAMDALRLPPGDAEVTTLSGGERRRVALCRLLLSRPDLLLLDEPTNHLDAESVQWLEQHLAAYPGTVLAVTHDRYFLDNVAGWILELDRGRAYPYEGNYSTYLETKAARLAAEARVSAGRKRVLQRELEWVRAGTKGRHDKGRARLRRYEELATEAERERPLDFDEIQVPPGPRLGEVVVETKGLTKGYGDRLLIDELSFSLPRGGIVGVIGANGAGKTTLFKLITSQERPDAGELRLGPTVQLAYVDQDRARLDGSKTVFEAISGGLDHFRVGGREMPTRAYVATFGFKGTDQQKPVGVLSGGERNRLNLALTLREGGNLLLLDEPTNDLDVDTLRSLESALLDFPGCAVVISHDRWFLDRIATHMLAFEGDSRVVWFEGNFADYQADKLRRLGPEAARPHRVTYRKLVRD